MTHADRAAFVLKLKRHIQNPKEVGTFPRSLKRGRLWESVCNISRIIPQDSARFKLKPRTAPSERMPKGAAHRSTSAARPRGWTASPPQPPTWASQRVYVGLHQGFLQGFFKGLCRDSRFRVLRVASWVQDVFQGAGLRRWIQALCVRF